MQTYEDFFQELSQTNVCSLIISVTTLVTLVLINELNDRQAYKGWFRRPRRRGKRIPIPSELVVVSVLPLNTFFTHNFGTRWEEALPGISVLQSR